MDWRLVLSQIVQKMFDKFLGKKRKEDVFIIPERKFASDLKNASKLTPKGLLELVSDMEKYLNSLTEKMQQARVEYDRVLQKSDQFKEKNDVVNAQIAKMTNEQEQLTIKFDNLQLALESMSTSNEEMIKQEQAFLLQNSSTQERFKSIGCFLKFYRSQTLLCKKVETQNKLLKEKYILLEEQLHATQENTCKLIPEKQAEKSNDPGETAHTDTSERQVNILANHFHEDQSKSQLEIHESEKREMDLQFNKANEEIKQLLSEREEMEEKLRQTAAQAESLRLIIASQERNQQVEYLMGLNATLQMSLEECKDSLHKFECEKIKLEQLIKSLTEELTALKSGEKKIMEEHTRIITVMREECKALEKIRDNHEEQLQKMGVQMREKVAEAGRKAILSKDEEIHALNKSLSVLNTEVMALRAQKTERLHQLESVSEECKGKVRKYECELNQQRIKNESMTRKINNLQAKTEENKISMDTMYEQGIGKDKKIAQMELKLKEYKRMIQLLRKEKEDIERDYESKLKGLTENAIIQHPDQVLTERSAAEEDQSKEAEITLKNEILSMKEHDSILQQQNDQLRVQITELESILQDKDSLIQGLQNKRDQIMKQIEKMGPGSQIYNQIHTHLQPRASEVKENHNREKKIAGKAVKGFEILGKLHQSLYKDFMAVFTKEVEKEELKKIEAGINTLVKKSADMKDIFLDYM